MHFIIFSVVAFFIIGIIWSMFQPKEKSQEIWNRITSLFTKKNKVADTLKIWAENSLDNEPQLQTWLIALPDEGLEIMGEKISGFCEEMGVDMYWVLDENNEIELQKKQATEEIMIDYCNLCLKATRNL